MYSLLQEQEQGKFPSILCVYSMSLKKTSAVIVNHPIPSFVASCAFYFWKDQICLHTFTPEWM